MILAVILSAALWGQHAARLHPGIQQAAGEVSAQLIEASMRKLESFETRDNYSDASDEKRGIGAARKWIYEEFRRYGGRLEVRYDRFTLERQGRIVRPFELVNVVAVLKGKRQPERQIVVCAHYDSLNVSGSKAPGASDNASGVAAVLEMARVLSRQEFDKTLVFVAFAGEELGLVGSNLYARRAKESGQTIEAVLNSDVIGTDSGGDGRKDNRHVRVFSADPADSPSRQLARYVRDVGHRYTPELEANLIFRIDRYGRLGDHISFEQQGFPAIRFTSAVEHYQHQHSGTDTLEHASPAYAAKVAKLKTAVAASLAQAPNPPVLSAPPSRGASTYEASLSWSYGGDDSGVIGYSIVMRRTTAPFWEREIHVGKRRDYTIAGADIDDWIFGVKAVGADGLESVTAAWAPEEPEAFRYKVED